MNLRRASVLAVLLLAACVEGAPPAVHAPAPAPEPPRCLSIVAWNDLHGQLSPDEPMMDTGRVPAGGVVALADQLAAVRASADAVVVLDAGDLFTGPMASSMAEGAPVIQAENLLGVDAATLGNHDFDFGPVGYERVTAPTGVGDEAGAAGPRGALLARMAEAKFPFVSANIHKKGGAPTGWPNLRASVIVERGGYKVGVVGYTTLDTPATTLKANVSDLDFATGAAANVAEEIRALRAAGASPVVLLAHAGIDGDMPASLADDRPHTGELATLTSSLGADKPDLILAGHRHAWLLGRLSGVPVVSADQHGVGLSRARFCGSPASPQLAGVELRAALAVGSPSSELGSKVAAMVTPWEQKVKVIADAPVTTLSRVCEPKGPSGTALADQMAHAIAEHASDASAPPKGTPVVGLVNVGGLRAPIGPGPARFRDVFTVSPFENTVAVCGTTRAGLSRVFENALQRQKAPDRFPLGVWGAKLRVRREANGTSRLVSAEVEGLPRDAKGDAPVWLAVSDFVLWGGDDLLEGVTCAPRSVSPTRVREAWQKVLERERACDGPSRNVTLE